MCEFNLAHGSSLLLFQESSRQDQKDRPIKEPQKPVAVATDSHTNLPEIFCAYQFLEVLWWNNIKFFNQTKNPCHFLGMLIRERVKKFLDRASSSGCPVELNHPHE